ncbi:non-homologous end-joining DNA ligase [Jatrophihabitans sp.]|uniref:non-homologous end-joining DNA ligase n=1 Tax=Jatrophihabitans sp. TaxID=1932789 RepID=UPI002BD8B36A|nr:non-homologous end-joining DNA ligase [Jatrophihabitans sp.]
MRHAARSADAGPAVRPAGALPNLTPMLACPGELPGAAEDAQWGYETKWDGARLLAFVDGDRVRLRSRNDLDVTVSYPELAGLGGALGGGRAVLDGEVVAFGADGLPSFARLQRRMHVGQAGTALRLSGTDPIRFLVFDVLHLDGRDTVGLPYLERRGLLAGLELDGASWQCPPYFAGNGALVLRASKELGLEGVVAKRLSSTYRPGRRSPDWRKIKNIRMQEVVVLGWQPGNGRRAGTIGSLLVGVPGEPGPAGGSGALRYAGKVGTGFTEVALAALLRRLGPLTRQTPPLAVPPPRAEAPGAQWVEPVLVGEVGFGEWTPDGRLRHPVWRGLRPDKSVADVRIEG